MKNRQVENVQIVNTVACGDVDTKEMNLYNWRNVKTVSKNIMSGYSFYGHNLYGRPYLHTFVARL